MATEPIIEARAIEKSYPQPDGTRIQVVGLTDFAIEPGKIIALLGASGCGKSTLLRILSGSGATFVRSAVLAWQAAGRRIAERGDRLPEFRAVSLAYGLGECGSSTGSARRGCRGAPQARAAHAGYGGSGWFRDGLSQGAFRRDEAARRLRARAGGGTGSAVHGRTILCARCAHGGKSARRTAGAMAEQEDADQRDLHCDAQHRGGGDAGGPHRGAGQKSGAHPRGFQCASFASPRPQVWPLCGTGGLHLQNYDRAGCRACLARSGEHGGNCGAAGRLEDEGKRR